MLLSLKVTVDMSKSKQHVFWLSSELRGLYGAAEGMFLSIPPQKPISCLKLHVRKAGLFDAVLQVCVSCAATPPPPLVSEWKALNSSFCF